MMPEYVILYFMAICLLMIGFNIAFVLAERARARWEERRVEDLSQRFVSTGVLADAVSGADAPSDAPAPSGSAHPARDCSLDEAHRDEIVSMCTRLMGMEALDRALDKAEEANPGCIDAISPCISGALEFLAHGGSERSDLKRAFFAYLVRRWYRRRPARESVIYCLQRDLLSSSLYVRQNAFEALAHVAPAAEVAHALDLIDGGDGAHNPRLVTETLLAVTGDVSMLAHALDRHLEMYRPQTAAAVINFMRMRGVGDAPHLLAIMADDACDRETRLACVRYFMRRPHREALPVLLRFCSIEDPSKWEFVAVAAMALSAYPGEASVRTLKALLTSASWFVRFNAAKSLYDLGCTLDGDLVDVLEAGDRYASDMLVYRWQLEGQLKGDVRG